MQPDRKLARTAGLLYLLMIAGTGAFFGITQSLTAGDAPQAIAKVQASMGLFQFAILSGAAGLAGFTLLGAWLYRLFRAVNEAAAMALVVLVGVHAAISLAAIARLMEALQLIREPNLAGSSQVALSLLGYNTLWNLSFLFSGLWLIPLGWLVYRSGFLPKFVGIAAIVGSVFYMMTFAGWVMNPGYNESLVGRIIGIASGVPSMLGEAGTCLSLIVYGLRRTTRLP